MRWEFVCGVSLGILLLAAGPGWTEPPCTIKVVEAAAPQEVAEGIRPLLADKCVQLLDPRGELLLELWFRKTLPAMATEIQIKNGLTYAEIAETTVLGALRVVQETTDYRKQKIKPGVYTLRLATQPVSDDHSGTTPHPDFCLAVPASDDTKPDTLETKTLHKMSIKATNKHPAVFLLFPGKEATTEPKLVNKGKGHWVLMILQDVIAEDRKATLGIGLTLIGTSPAA